MLKQLTGIAARLGAQAPHRHQAPEVHHLVDEDEDDLTMAEVIEAMPDQKGKTKKKAPQINDYEAYPFVGINRDGGFLSMLLIWNHEQSRYMVQVVQTDALYRTSGIGTRPVPEGMFRTIFAEGGLLKVLDKGNHMEGFVDDLNHSTEEWFNLYRLPELEAMTKEERGQELELVDYLLSKEGDFWVTADPTRALVLHNLGLFMLTRAFPLPLPSKGDKPQATFRKGRRS